MFDAHFFDIFIVELFIQIEIKTCLPILNRLDWDII